MEPSNAGSVSATNNVSPSPPRCLPVEQSESFRSLEINFGQENGRDDLGSTGVMPLSVFDFFRSQVSSDFIMNGLQCLTKNHAEQSHNSPTSIFFCRQPTKVNFILSAFISGSFFYCQISPYFGTFVAIECIRPSMSQCV